MKDISKQEVVQHLKRLNRWWSPGFNVADVENVKTPRAYLPAVRDLVTDVRLRRAVVLLGPRRVGKTILIRHLIADLISTGEAPRSIGYVELDHPLLRDESLESLVDLMVVPEADAPVKLKFVFFDEVQYLKNWEQHLKALVDHRPDLRVLVSGSAAAALRRQSAESGAGRFTDFLLPPLTFVEYLKLKGDEKIMEEIAPDAYRVPSIEDLNAAFVDYVNFGGYPELALSEVVRSDPARFVKSDIVDKVLLRDLPQLYGIQDVQELNSLFTILAYNTGGEVSPEELAKRSGVGKPTINRYVEYLEAAFLLKRVYRVDQSGKRYQRERAFKVFLTNPAMRTGLFGPIGEDDEGFGHLVETALYAQRFHENARLNYARWGKADCEIDMIESNAALRPVFAIEIKWSDRALTKANEFSAVLKFCESNGLKHAWVTTRTGVETQTHSGITVQFWPAAFLAYHLGARAIRGHLSSFHAEIDSNKSPK